MSRAMTTRFGRWVLAGLLAAALGTGPATAADPPLPPLRVGIAPNYPPLAFKEDGKLQGIEVDFAGRLGKELGREVILVEIPWEQLGKAMLEEKRIDMVMSGTSITEQRKKNFDFTDPYLEVGQMALVRTEDFVKLRDPAAMDLPTSRVGFISRTTGEEYARNQLKRCQLKGYKTTEEGVAALENNEIDFFIQDAPAVWRVTGGFFTENPKVKGLYKPLTQEYLAWVLPKGNPELLAQLNAVIKKWKADGTLDDVIDDWITVKKTSVEVIQRQK